MWANLRRALIGAGALWTLVACSGSSSAPATKKRPEPTTAPPGATAPPGTTTSTSSPGTPSPAPLSPTGPGPTSVPPPVPGNISQTVAPGTIAPLRKVGLDGTAHFGKASLTATLADPSRVQAQAHIPGEIAGPALSFTLELTNHGRRSLDLATTIAVTAQDAAGTPFSALTTSTHAVGGTLRPGAEASGRYVFHLPDNTKNPVTISVTYAATAEVARFVGPIS